MSFIGYFAMFCVGICLFKILSWVKYRKINGVAECLAIPFTLKKHIQEILKKKLGPDKPKYTNHIIYT